MAFVKWAGGSEVVDGSDIVDLPPVIVNMLISFFFKSQTR